MRIRLLLIAAVTLTVGFSGSTSESRAPPDPHTVATFGRGIYTTAGADYARIADLGFRTVIIVDRWKANGVQGFFTYTWNCCGDPETLSNHPELWDTWR